MEVTELELDPPKAQEVLVKLTVSGLCHSDDHLVTVMTTTRWPSTSTWPMTGANGPTPSSCRPLQPPDVAAQRY